MLLLIKIISFNEQYTFDIVNNDGVEKNLSFYSCMIILIYYNGSNQMEGQYNETNIIYDILTLSKTARKEFEESNYTGQVRSAESFLLPAIEEVFDRMSKGLPSLGFENTMEIFEPDEMVEFTSNGEKYKIQPTTLLNI